MDEEIKKLTTKEEKVKTAKELYYENGNSRLQIKYDNLQAENKKLKNEIKKLEKKLNKILEIINN